MRAARKHLRGAAAGSDRAALWQLPRKKHTFTGDDPRDSVGRSVEPPVGERPGQMPHLPGVRNRRTSDDHCRGWCRR